MPDAAPPSQERDLDSAPISSLSRQAARLVFLVSVNRGLLRYFILWESISTVTVSGFIFSNTVFQTTR